jgi:diacylglycerol kinase (ATP)
MQSLSYAVAGVIYCIRTQRNMKIHLVIAAVALMLSGILKISALEFAMIVITISLVFICEIINTAVEKAVDTATSDYNPTAKIAKDVAAGAVLVSAISSVIIGLLVFGRHLLAVIGQGL